MPDHVIGSWPVFSDAPEYRCNGGQAVEEPGWPRQFHRAISRRAAVEQVFHTLGILGVGLGLEVLPEWIDGLAGRSECTQIIPRSRCSAGSSPATLASRRWT